MVRSVLAVVASYAVTVAVVIAFVLVASALWPAAVAGRATWLLAVEVVVSLAGAVAGGVVLLRVAGRAERVHAAVFSGLLALLGLATLIQELGQKPTWSILATVVAGPLGVLLATALRRPAAARA